MKIEWFGNHDFYSQKLAIKYSSGMMKWKVTKSMGTKKKYDWDVKVLSLPADILFSILLLLLRYEFHAFFSSLFTSPMCAGSVLN